MPMGKKDRFGCRRAGVNLVNAAYRWQNSEFLKAFLVFRRKERWSIKLFLAVKDMPKSKKTLVSRSWSRILFPPISLTPPKKVNVVWSFTMRFHFGASVFLRTFEIVEIMFHIVNMLKIRVYLEVPAFLITSTSPPAFK